MDLFNQANLLPFIEEPSDEENFNAWVKQDDVFQFLEQELNDENIIIYAALPFGFIHAVLIPNISPDSSNIDDLLSWDTNPTSTWSQVISSDDVWIEGPLEGSNSITLSRGEQIIFARSFNGVESMSKYYELNQRMSQVLDIHHMDERNAWCQLDKHGDIEEIVKIITVTNSQDKDCGTIVVMNKKALSMYASIENYSICRMFDFTRYRAKSFSGWGANSSPIEFNNGNDIFGTLVVYSGYGSYSRGIQLCDIRIPKKNIIEKFWNKYSSDEKYATFIAQDWKNNRVEEISCAPSDISNYFTESDLPFEMSPAFFRPEVLLKYKSDREKYSLNYQSISCRGSWSLETFSINDAGQVATYLGYLNRLPYEEQLHWKQYNEYPKAPLSKETIATDFHGQWDTRYDPLINIKERMRKLIENGAKWWTLRNENLIDNTQYPYTSSSDEWAGEIQNLDQMMIEGFNDKWLRQKAKELQRNPPVTFRALKLIEECLIGMGFNEDHAHEIMTPFHDVHNLRSLLAAHAWGSEATESSKKAIQEFGNYREHYRHLCEKCDESLEIIIEAFKDF